MHRTAIVEHRTTIIEHKVVGCRTTTIGQGWNRTKNSVATVAAIVQLGRIAIRTDVTLSIIKSLRHGFKYQFLFNISTKPYTFGYFTTVSEFVFSVINSYFFLKVNITILLN